MDDVDSAMDLLLTKKQIAYVKSQTKFGRSRVQIVRLIFNLGYTEDVAYWKNESKETEIAILRGKLKRI